MKAGASNPSVLLFQRRKLSLTFWIMGVGMLVALGWDAWQDWVVGSEYPYNTFLYGPAARFTDFTDNLYISCLANPYNDSEAFYLPFAWAFFRLITPFSCTTSLIGFLFVSLGGLILFLSLALKKIIPQRGKRVILAFALVAFAYPVAMCVDRGNLEILLVLLTVGMVYFFLRGHYLLASVCLVVAISFKLYPALLLTLFWRQRKMGLILMICAAAGLLGLGAMAVLSLPFPVTWHLYSQNMIYFTQRDVYENYSLEGSATLWNPYKFALMKAGDWGIISPVVFSFDGAFLQRSYAIYSALMLGFVLMLMMHVTLIEREVIRGATLLFLFMAIAVPSGADYRLLFVCVALVLQVVTESRRKWDMRIVMLLAFTLVPKKEVFLGHLGQSAGGGDQVPLQVILNPLCITLALFLLVRDGWDQYNAAWSKLRLGQLLRTLRRFFALTRPGTPQRLEYWKRR